MEKIKRYATNRQKDFLETFLPYDEARKENRTLKEATELIGFFCSTVDKTDGKIRMIKTRMKLKKADVPEFVLANKEKNNNQDIFEIEVRGLICPVYVHQHMGNEEWAFMYKGKYYFSIHEIFIKKYGVKSIEDYFDLLLKRRG